jgi:uncharacterized membrane protein
MSTPAPWVALRSRVGITRKTALWFVMFLMGLMVLYRDAKYLNPHNDLRPHFFLIRWFLLPHLSVGIIAMLAGPVQFSSRIRRKHPRFHRLLGRAYVVSILIAAPLAITMPVYLKQDKFYIAGTVVHAGSWFVCTLIAFLIARNRHIQQHRQWMIRSYALTFSFIVVRVFGHFVPLADPEFGMADAIITFIVLLVPDIAMSWREIITRRVGASTAPLVASHEPAHARHEPVGANLA